MKQLLDTIWEAHRGRYNPIADAPTRRCNAGERLLRRRAFAMVTACVLIFCFVSCLAVMGAEATNSPSNQEYQAFKLIAERNIFNPNRRSGLVAGPPPKVEKQSKIEAFALVGTLIDEGGSLAFFDGTDSQYKKVLKPTEAIAGYKVLEIDIEHVKLQSDGNEVKLPIGMQMKRKDEDPWQLIAATGSFENTSRRGDPARSDSGKGDPGRGDSRRGDSRRSDSRRSDSRRSDSRVGQDQTSASPQESAVENTTSDNEPASSGDADEVLKRLMQKREEELNKGKP